MRLTLTSLTVSLSITISLLAHSQAKPTAHGTHSASSPAPLYRISFRRGEPIAGVAASRAIAMPFQCTSDGTVFINMVLQASAYSVPAEQLVSIPPSGEAHEFRLDQLTDLYDIMRKGYYASESNVAFLVIAASEDKQGKETFVTPDGTKHEVTRNLADRRDYIVLFDREGNYKKKLQIQIDDTFAIQRIGVFPSGTFLALGFDTQDHSPRLALLQDDARFLRFLEMRKRDAPETMFGMKDSPGKGVVISIAPSQFVPHRDSIIIVQNNSKYPLLEVNEAGAIREIKPKLPEEAKINGLIPSDEGLYAQTSEASDGLIYELNPQDGKVIRSLQVDKSTSELGVACVHDGKFLSFEHADGKLNPLIGTPEPAVSAEKTKPSPPTN